MSKCNVYWLGHTKCLINKYCISYPISPYSVSEVQLLAETIEIHRMGKGVGELLAQVIVWGFISDDWLGSSTMYEQLPKLFCFVPTLFVGITILGEDELYRNEIRLTEWGGVRD